MKGKQLNGETKRHIVQKCMLPAGIPQKANATPGAKTALKPQKSHPNATHKTLITNTRTVVLRVFPPLPLTINWLKNKGIQNYFSGADANLCHAAAYPSEKLKI